MPADIYTRRQTEPQPPTPAPLLIDEKSAAVMLGGICVKSLYNLRRRRGLPFVQIGTRILYRPADLARWIDEQARTQATVSAEGSGR